MNQKLINTLMFATGAAIGSLVTWRVLKSYYEQYVQDEIDAFVEEWSQRDRDARVEDDQDEFEDEEIDEEDEDSGDDFDETEVHDYHRLAKKYGGEGDGDDEVPYDNGPYVISPDEFGDGNFKHSLKCLTYYNGDGVLANDWYETFDVEETIGEEALEHFGDYQTDVVHVRNEREESDYEVVRDPRTFAEVSADDPLMAKYAT